MAQLLVRDLEPETINRLKSWQKVITVRCRAKQN